MSFRRNLLIIIATVTAIGSLGGCATASGPAFSGVQVPEQGSAQTYVYRKPAFFAAGQGFKVDMDGASAGEIVNGSYIVVKTVPGEHVVAVKPGGFAPDFKYQWKAEAGKTYFLEFDFNSGPIANIFFAGSEVKARSEEVALKDLGALKAAK